MLPVLVVTGLLPDAMAAVADPVVVLCKPFDAAALVRAVEDLMAETSPLQERAPRVVLEQFGASDVAAQRIHALVA